ncbi:MAG: hypothetical protein JW787_05145 [Sedimentisphaerales bacterium]|nr:hypothetical protein [Sedimentisphaerales bacterium]
MLIPRYVLSRFRLGIVIFTAICAAALAGNNKPYQDVVDGTSGQQREFLANLIEKIDSPNDCFDLIKRRFLDGNFEDAEIALDLRDSNGEYIFSGYRFAQLRAQCASAVFTQYSRGANPLGRPSEEQGTELRRLAQNTTKAYEEAFSLAPSDFEKACVYARWHELNCMSRYEADSLLLRSGSPLEHLNEPISEKLEQQLSILRETVSGSIESVAIDGKPLASEEMKAFVDVMVDEYKVIGRIDVPNDVFNEIIDDIPEFLEKAIHQNILKEPEKYHASVQYHLWYALTGSRPDAIDNEYIDNQVEIIDKYIHEKFGAGLPEYEEQASNNFLELIKIERKNRLIPRFKQPVLPYQWSQPYNKYQKSIHDNIVEDIDNTIARVTDDRIQQLNMSTRMRTSSVNRMPERISSSIRSLVASIELELMNYHRIHHYHQPPGMIFSGSSGTTHDKSGIWVFTTDKNIPIPTYPWKKSITDIDESIAGTRQIAGRVLRALNQGDTTTLDTIITESRDFSKEDIYKLIEIVGGQLNTVTPGLMQDTNDILIEEVWKWSAVRLSFQANNKKQSLFLIIQNKAGGFWLAWAGLVNETPEQSLAAVFNRLKPGLELPPVTETVEFARAVNIVTINDISEMESLKSIKAGSDWQVRLATITAGDVTKELGQSSWQMLYCKATWNDANKPPKTIPFGRFEGQHLGPVVWTLSTDGFRETPLKKSSRAVPPISVRGEGCVYAAIIPVEGIEEAYLQVYSAIDGRELARRQISQSESTQPWGRFMTYQKDIYFGVPENFAAARPAIPAFTPIYPLPEKTSIKLSLEDDFFELKTDKRILPTQGSRLLARWWLNGEPVMPKVIQDVNFPGYTETEGFAKILRLPAAVPIADLNVKKGDKIDLQIMLSPDCIKSASNNKLNDFSFDDNRLPCTLILSNKISFTADSKMLVKRKSQTVTAAQFKSLTDEIENGNINKVKSLVSACPELIYFRNNSKMSALDFVCYTRPRPRQLFVVRLGGHTNAQYWKTMSEIAGILLDYGSEINTEGWMNKAPLQTLLDEEDTNDKDKAVPVELVRLLIDRGADLKVGQVSGNSDGTILHQAVKIIQSYKSDRLVPVVKILLEYGADVFAISDPWERQPVYDKVDSIKKNGFTELAEMISKSGEERLKPLESKVKLGVEEFLSSVRYAGEKELAALSEELPIERGMDWLRSGRSLQKDFGPGLQALSDERKIYLTGNWAEAVIPTGLEGEKANLFMALLKYPGGDYHVIRTRLSEDREPGRHLGNTEISYRQLMNAVYYSFGQIYRNRTSGNMGTGYPGRFNPVSITTEKGLLAAQGVNLSSWIFRTELTKDNVFYWEDTWELNIATNITFSSKEQPDNDKSIYMADGCITIKNASKTIIFSLSGDKVRMQSEGEETFSSEFILDLNTLDIKNRDSE